MCGLCGWVGASRVATAGRDVEEMTSALLHRGPDDRGLWTTGFRAGATDHAVALGHTRLAIIDLSPLGHQPMHARGGATTVAYNGELYNFRELRDELRERGVEFRSDSDTEVLLEAWQAWGEAAFARLNGMFAFALWDAPARRLYLVRDRLGIKPLYYRFHQGDLSFGSELGALRRHPGFEARIDRAALGRFLRHGYVCGPETIYQGTRRLLPGELLVWQAGRIEVRPYWRIEDPAPPPPERFEDVVDALDELLGDAIERQMISDVPIGAFLSGGVDSSTVVAIMQERARRPVRTFSIGFREPRWDEAPFARAVAEHLKTDHTELYVDRSDAVEAARELPAIYDEPFADASAIPTVLLARLTRRHVTVALSGDGGDELFGGYPHHARFHRLRPWLALPAGVRLGLARLARGLPSGPLTNALRHLRESDPARLAYRFQSAFDDDELAAACGAEGAQPSAVYLQAFRAAPVTEAVRRAMFADARLYLPDDILAKVDRATMSVALEARVPLLDHRVAEFALALPLSITWRGGVTKAPLREVLHRRVPRVLVERPKHGFGIPLHVLLEAELRAWRERYLAPERLAEEGLLDPSGVRRLLDAARRRRDAAFEATLRWRVLCFERWLAHTQRGETLD